MEAWSALAAAHPCSLTGEPFVSAVSKGHSDPGEGTEEGASDPGEGTEERPCRSRGKCQRGAMPVPGKHQRGVFGPRFIIFCPK